MPHDLHPEEILKLEFEYARETAAQAQNDRTIIVNLYLLLVGGAGSLLFAAVSFVPLEQRLLIKEKERERRKGDEERRIERIEELEVVPVKGLGGEGVLGL